MQRVMMESPAPISEAEYLAGEALSPVKHEYLDGEIRAMAGASIRHNRISGNLYLQFRLHSHCRASIADVKVQTPGAYYYPDVLLSCAAETDPYVEREPCLIAEVLSPTTEVIDRTEKLRRYRRVPSLQAYLLVDQQAPRIEVYRRAGELWVYDMLEVAGELALPCLERPLSLAAVYEGIEFPSGEASASV
jgi:Uma2 family endonuclease